MAGCERRQRRGLVFDLFCCANPPVDRDVPRQERRRAFGRFLVVLALWRYNQFVWGCHDQTASVPDTIGRVLLDERCSYMRAVLLLWDIAQEPVGYAGSRVGDHGGAAIVGTKPGVEPERTFQHEASPGLVEMARDARRGPERGGNRNAIGNANGTGEPRNLGFQYHHPRRTPHQHPRPGVFVGRSDGLLLRKNTTAHQELQTQEHRRPLAATIRVHATGERHIHTVHLHLLFVLDQ